MKPQDNRDWILDENGFELHQAQLYRPWYNYICNAEYGIKISHLGDAYSTTMAQPRIAVSNYDFFHPSKGRFLFVRDGSSVWSPSYWPCKTELDSYACRHESGATQFTGELNGIKTTLSIFVPETGTAELWHVSAENTGTAAKTFELYPEMEFLLYNSFSVDPVYYSWYSDTRVDDKGAIIFERRIGDPAVGFFAPLGNEASGNGASGSERLEHIHSGKGPVVRQAGLETSLKRFLGNSDISRPEAVANGSLSGAMSGGDPYIAAFRYILSLEPGQKAELAFAAGCGLGTLDAVRETLPDPTSVRTTLERTRAEWKKKTARGFFPLIPEGDFRNWLDTFFAYQIYQQSTGMVRGTYRGFRDVAQDVMGISRYDGKAARALLLDLGTRMKTSGQCLRQWNTEGGANDERDFRDLPFWLILALETYERYTGDSSIYTERVPYLDSPAGARDSGQNETLWQHAMTGIAYSLKYGDHGLVLMGAGDWNDALSGPGKTGGTTFLNQIAYLALSTADSVAKKHGFAHGFDIAAEQQRLYDGVMRYWNGEWFARAVTETGEIVGDEHDATGSGNDSRTRGRVFLLPQIWFTLCGMDKRSPEAAAVAKQALDTALARLERPEGLLKCDPGYHAFDPKAGNLSALTPGMAENFAVYNHSAAFAAYALLTAGRKADAERILAKILPIAKDWRTTKAEPYVLVNFYNGGYYPEKKGEGGIPWLTGTVNWLARCFFDFPGTQPVS